MHACIRYRTIVMKSVTKNVLPIKLFVLDPLWDRLVTPKQLTALKASGLIIVVDATPKPLKEVKGLFEGAEPRILAINPDYLEWSLKNEDYKDIPGLQAIITQSTSFAWIELEAAAAAGTAVCNIRSFSAESVAEWAVMMMLALARKLPLLIKENFPLDLNNYQGMELKGKTVGIIGLGNIGTAVAARCLGMGMNVVYWSRKSSDKRFKKVSLEQVFQADVVVPTLASNIETNNLITQKLLRSMKLGALFVSVTEHYYDHVLLLKMVERGKLAGYGFESPNPADFKNYQGNVWAAPAYAWCTSTSMNKAMELWIDIMIAAANGHYPSRIN